MRRPAVLWASIILLAAFFYEGVFRSIVHGWIVLPLFPGGLPGLTAILAACSVAHAWYSLGGRPTAAFFAVSAAVSWAFEQAGVLTGIVYGPYHYTGYLGFKLGEVPLVIPMAWFMMIYPSYVIANLIMSGRPLGTPAGARRLIALAAASAVVMTAWDLVIDPILSGPSVRAWIWEGGGPYFGVPLHNYAGWLLTTFTVYLLFRLIEQQAAGAGSDRTATLDARVAAVPLAIYGLMLVSELVSGVAPAGLAVIGPVVMGIPLAAAAIRLRSYANDGASTAQ